MTQCKCHGVSGKYPIPVLNVRTFYYVIKSFNRFVPGKNLLEIVTAYWWYSRTNEGKQKENFWIEIVKNCFFFKQRLYGMAVEVVPRRPSDMRRSVAAGPTTTLTALYHHGPSMMASSAVRDGGFNEHDLIYVTKSPDYCRRDRSSGSLGTVGRTCNASTAAHGGSCNSLCCGRGYVTSHREQVERCYCKYIWCCTVN